MKGYIYLIENKINGKKYVGKTYRTIDLRWKEHLRDIKRYPNKPLYKAILKYGENNFTIVELEYTENCEEREIFWISFYDSFKNGYNATLGGDGYSYFEYSDEEVIEVFLKTLSIKDTATFFDCDHNTISKRLTNNGIKIAKGGNINGDTRFLKAVEVCQYSLQGEFIQSFDSYSQAADWLRDNNYTAAQHRHVVCNISKVCRGIENRRQSYGFIWKNSPNPIVRAI